MSEQPKAVVIGAGLGGLSAAIRLAAHGWKVTIYEANHEIGGKAGILRAGAYRFDTGPSLFTMPAVFEDVFQVAGTSMADYIKLIPLSEICRYFYSNGLKLGAWRDQERFADELHGASGETPENLARFLDYSSKIYKIAGELFIHHSLHDKSTYFRFDFLKSLLRLPGIDSRRTMAKAIERYLKTPEARQLFERYATYNGSHPFRAPATLNMIPHVEYRLGAFAVAGGIHTIPRALDKLAQEMGVTVNCGCTVDQINWVATRRHRRVTGVRIEKTFIPAHAIVCNADVSVAYRDLLNEPEAPELKRYEGLEPSSSALVFYWGMNREFPELASHNIFFSRDYPVEFSQIFDGLQCPDDPTVYLNITSKTTKDDAPPGGENWFVMINAPYDSGQDWGMEVERIRKTVLATISSRLGLQVEPHIVFEDMMTPADIAGRTHSFRGSLYGISSNTRSAAFLRHPNKSRRYNGLYFCGGSAHPGGGMPLVTMGGKIASELILRHQPQAALG